MRRHVIRSFVSMKIIRSVLRHESVENLPQIMAHVRIRVLIKRQSSRRMLYEKVKQPFLGERTDLSHNITGDKIYATWIRPQCDFSLIYHIQIIKECTKITIFVENLVNRGEEHQHKRSGTLNGCCSVRAFLGKLRNRCFKFRHGNAIRGSFDTDEDSIRAQSGKIRVVSLVSRGRRLWKKIKK